MLDIISMTILLIILSSIGIVVGLVLIASNMKMSERERRYEDEEQMKYLKEYSEKHKKNRKN